MNNNGMKRNRVRSILRNRVVMKWFMAKWGACAFIMIVSVTIYGKTLLFNQFVELDDRALLTHARTFTLSINTLSDVFSTMLVPDHYDGFYRPLLMLSCIADTHIARFVPFNPHATNILIHIITSCELYILLILLYYRRN